MKMVAVLLCFFFMFIIFGNVFADTLYLKNGTQFTGQLVKQDAEKIIFRVGGEEDGVEVTFFNEEVLRIDKAEVSSFITLPFGEGKQIEIPRPIFEKEPLLTEQARLQLKQKSQTEEAEQADTQLEDLSKTEEVQQLVDEYSEILPKATEGDLYLQGSKVSEELSLLLDKEEQDYFVHINSMVKGVTSKMANLLTNPNALIQGGDALKDLIKEMPPEIEGIIKKLEDLQMPDLFVNFHKKYLDNLDLMKDVFGDMSKGDILSSQTKMQDLQNMHIGLQEELSRILEIKKNKSR